MAFAINELEAGHTKEAFGAFAKAVGGKVLGQVKNIVPRVGAFFGKRFGEGASGVRATEKALHLANQGGKAQEIDAARKAYEAALNVGKQKQYLNTAKTVGEKMHGNLGFDAVTGKQLATPGSLQGGVDAAYKNLAPWQQKGVSGVRMVKDFAMPRGPGGVPLAALTFSGLAGLGNKEEALAQGRAQGIAETSNSVANKMDELGQAGLGDRLSQALQYVGRPSQMNQYADNLRAYALNQDHYN